MFDFINADFENVRSLTDLNLDDIKKLLQLYLSNCYFLWDDRLYEIEGNGPIGLSLMIFVAEVFFQFIEKDADQQAIHAGVTLKS